MRAFLTRALAHLPVTHLPVARLPVARRLPTRKAALRMALAGALSMLLLIGTGGDRVRAEEDDELPDVKMFRSIMRGLGLRKPGEENHIEYRERSPLVVPPSRDLPPPETASVVERNPAWPEDTDVKRRREAKQNARKSIDWEDEARSLSPRELNRQGASRTAAAPAAGQKPTEEAINPVKPSELGYGGGLFSWRSLMGAEPKEEYGSFDKEPRRTDLTQPPPGYLTPSPNQPYGVGKSTERAKPANPMDAAVGSAETR
ncbi:MAG: hypothetical protein HZA68_21400 [Rhodovulum sp.]|nr:hypothetical protein [Rhodovulum sp.]